PGSRSTPCHRPWAPWPATRRALPLRRSSPSKFPPGSERSAQRRRVVFAHVDREVAHAGDSKPLIPFDLPGARRGFPPAADPGAAHVEGGGPAGLRVPELDPPLPDRLELAGVVDRDRGHIVAGGELPERPVPIGGEEVGQEDDDPAVP